MYFVNVKNKDIWLFIDRITCQQPVQELCQIKS